MLTNITIEETRELLNKQEILVKIEGIDILESLDYILAEDIKSDMPMPPFNRSPLDGYAYKAEDTIDATEDLPVKLKVIDNIQAGHISEFTVSHGQAIRIMTGAKLPEGADVIIRYEDTEFTDKQVLIFDNLQAGSNIVKMGEDMLVGDKVLSTGDKIGPAEVGILASLGRKKIKVFSKPKVAILATGDELVDIDEDIVDGKIRNSNSYMIAAQVKRLGIEPKLLGICKDKIEDGIRVLKDALEWADLIVTTGGASVGDADIIKEVFTGLGAEILFWRVQIKPGTPIVGAKYHNKILFGLSGNPAAAFMTFEQFVRPMILKMMGKSNLKLMKIESTLNSDFTKNCKQNRYVRAFTYTKDGKYYTQLPDKHSSGVLSSLSGKNSIFFIPAGSGPYKKGDVIDVELIDYVEVNQ